MSTSQTPQQVLDSTVNAFQPKNLHIKYTPPLTTCTKYRNDFISVLEKCSFPSCTAPAFCHISKDPSCKRTQEELESNEAKYLTSNLLCIDCLSMKVCCLVGVHHSEESLLKKAKIEIQPVSFDIKFRFTPYYPPPVVQDHNEEITQGTNQEITQGTNQGNNFIPEECKFFTFSCSDPLFDILKKRYFPRKSKDEKKKDDTNVLLDYPHKIFLRSSYKDLADLLFVERKNDFIEPSVAVVTGVPGIGKSTLQFYLLYRFMTSKHKEKSFILSYRITQYLFFEYISDFKYRMTSYPNITDIPNSQDKYEKNHFCILDFDSKDQIRFKSEYLNGDQLLFFFQVFLYLISFFLIGIILSSPDKKRYDQYIKSQYAVHRNQYVMPVWDNPELEIFSTVLQENQKSDWKSLHYYVGGVPRLLFNFNETENFRSDTIKDLTLTIQDKGVSIFQNLYSDKFNMMDDNKYKLIHMNPNIIRDSYNEISETFLTSIDYSVPYYKFATPYVERQLLTLIKDYHISE